MKGAIVDQDACIGCGLCVQLCPKVFEMQDDGKSKAIHPTGDEEATIQSSIDACPVTAIAWTEEVKEESAA
jgi:ferredoxin